MVGDLEAARVSGGDLRGGLGTREIAADGKQRERNGELVRQLPQAIEGQVVDESSLRTLRRGQPMNGEIVGDLVEVDADRAEPHRQYPRLPALGQLGDLGGEILGRRLVEPLAQRIAKEGLNPHLATELLAELLTD